MPPIFYYDFNSPYAYFAAHRIGDLIPDAEWRPISFGHLLVATDRVPWSLLPGREEQMRWCEARAAELGLPLQWPPDWPAGTYSMAVLRGAYAAGERIREFSLAAFHHRLGLGGDLSSRDATLAIGAELGLELDLEGAKARLTQVTNDAIARGIVGIPTVEVGDQRFWGDDQLEAAALSV